MGKTVLFEADAAEWAQAQLTMDEYLTAIRAGHLKMQEDQQEIERLREETKQITEQTHSIAAETRRVLAQLKAT